MSACSVGGCGLGARVLGMCRKHYQRHWSKTPRARAAKRRYRQKNLDRLRAAERARYARRKEAFRDAQRRFRERHPERRKKSNERWRKENGQKWQRLNRANGRRKVAEIRSHYARQLLGFGAKDDVPPALIEAKRVQLQLKRLVKDMTR